MIIEFNYYQAIERRQKRWLDEHRKVAYPDRLPFLTAAEARAIRAEPISGAGLQQRHPAWTSTVVRKLLGAPDAEMYREGGRRKIRVYFLSRVQKAETTSAFGEAVTVWIEGRRKANFRRGLSGLPALLQK